MQIVYIPYQQGTEQKIINAFLGKEGEIVKINKTPLLLPSVVNISEHQMPVLKNILGAGSYRWAPESVFGGTAPGTPLENFGVVLNQILSRSHVAKTDLIVVHKENENLDFIRDALHKWKITRK